MMFDSIEFAKKLKTARLEKQMTQTDLAKRSGMTPATISSYEKGSEKNATGAKKPSLENAVAMAEVLGVSLDYLCGTSGTQKYEIKNYADVVSHLRLLSEPFECSAGVRKVRLHPADVFEIGVDEYGEPIFGTTTLQAVFFIHDFQLARYFENRNKMTLLLEDEAIDKNLYDTWLAGEVERLRKIPVPKRSHGIFDILPDSDVEVGDEKNAEHNEADE